MKKYILILLSFLIISVTKNSFAFEPPAAPANGKHVMDLSGKMTSDQIDLLNQKIEKISETTHNEFGILLLPSMNGDNIEDVANSTFKSWGVGKKGLDNGFLIVVALKERKSRIETGKGVEDKITDLQANDLLKNHLNPHLKRGNFYEGFNETLDAMVILISPTTGETTGSKVYTPPKNNADNYLVLFLCGGVFLFVVFIWAISRKSRRQSSYSYSGSYDYGGSSSHSSSSSSSSSWSGSDSSSSGGSSWSGGGDSGFGGGDSGGGGSSSDW